MALRRALEVPSKSIAVKFIVTFALVFRSGMSMDLEAIDGIKGVTPGKDKSLFTSHEGRGLKRSDHSFFLNKVHRFYGFSSKSTKAESFPNRNPTEGTTASTSSHIVIPNEGGIVHITRPTKFRKRSRRVQENTTVGDLSTKVNSNSISIPDRGGPVHIDFPDYVKYGIKRKKKTAEARIPINNVTSKDSGNNTMHANDTVVLISTEVHGSGDSISGAGENVTEAVSDETSLTSQLPTTIIYIGNSDYPFFAAVHGKSGSPVSFDNVLCSGGIVSKTVVVTSCSCLYNDDWPIPLSLFYYVSVGHLKFANISETAVYFAPTVKYHPSCKKTEAGLWQGNIAMLTIAKPGIRFGQYVRPMNLPKLRMWDASDVLGKMSDQRRHCRVIGWSRRAPMIDTALGILIPLDECANPVCKKNLPCPRRNTVDGFMMEIAPNEPDLLPGALLYCSDHVFAIVNTRRQCRTNHVFAACSPEELLYSRYNFELTPEAKWEMFNYVNVFSKSIEGWQTYTYPPTTDIRTTAALPNQTSAKQEIFAKLVSSGSILFPFYPSREASWIYTYFIATGYYSFVFN